MKNKVFFILSRLAGLTVLLAVACVLALQSPKVQQKVTDAALARLRESFNGDIRVGEIRLLPFNTIRLSDIALLDKDPYTRDSFSRGWARVDTVIYAKQVSATFTLKGLRRGEGLHLGTVTVVDGGFNLVIEPDTTFGCNIARIMHSDKPSVDKEPGNIFDIRKVIVRNGRYTMVNFREQTSTPTGAGIWYDDLDIRADIEARGMRFSKGVMYGTVDHLNCFEKRGYRASHISGRCTVGNGRTLVEDIHLVDEWSDFRAESYSMTYNTPYRLSHFKDYTVMDVHALPGILSMRTISGISGTLGGCDVRWKIEKAFHAYGPLCNLRMEDVRVTDLNSGVSGTVNGRLYGLPVLKEFGGDVTVNDFSFTSPELSDFLSNWGLKADVSKYAPNRRMLSDIHVKGSADAPEVSVALKSPCGSLTSEAEFHNLITKEKDAEILAGADARNLDLESVFGVKGLGKVSMKFGGRVAFRQKSPVFSLDSLSVSSLEAFGHEYKGICANGVYGSSGGEAKLRIDDSALDMDGELGVSRIAKDGHKVTLHCNIPRVDLNEVGLNKAKKKSTLGCDLDVNLAMDKENGMNGVADIRHLVLGAENESCNAGDARASLSTDSDGQTVIFRAPWAEFQCNGKGDFQNLVKYIQDVTIRRSLPSLYPAGPAPKAVPADYYLEAIFFDTHKLLSFLLPGAYIAENSSLVASLDRTGLLIGSLESDRIAIGGNNIRNANVRFSNAGSKLEVSLAGKEMKAAGVNIRDFSTRLSARDDAFSMMMDFRAESESESRLLLDGSVSRRNGELCIKTDVGDSMFGLGGKDWKVSPSKVTFCDGALDIDGLAIQSGEELVFAKGRVSPDISDTLSVSIKDFDISVANDFLGDGLLGGRANGSAVMVSGKNGGGIFMDMVCDALAFGGTDAGSVRISGNWDRKKDLVKLNGLNEKDGTKCLYASGTFKPSTKDINGTVKLNKLNPAIAAPFIKDVFSEAGGMIDGEIRLGGNISKIDLEGSGITFDNTLLKMAYTGAAYILNGTAPIGSTSIGFDDIEISDGDGGRARLRGCLRHDHLKHFMMDAGVDFKELTAINSDSSKGIPVYGHIKADGSASVSGPIDALLITANVATSGSGEVHIPLSESLISAKSNLLTFTKEEREADPYETMILEIARSRKEEKRGDMQLKAHLDIRPGIDAMAEIDKSNGHNAVVNGTGSVDINFRPHKDIFTLDGDYSISSGSYHFVLPGIMDKDFSIESGSGVKFAGSLPESTLDIRAKHQLKTTLNTLIADSTAVATRRSVICGINISDKIANPVFSFAIDVPDLEPNMKAQVDGALNTDDKIQKQFVSLLLFGTFLPGEQSGVVNGTNVLFSNVSEVMSSQLNSILQKLEIPMDFGFGYQRNNVGSDIFDVAVSTQLWNNRVVVGGTIGNRQYSNSTENEMVGDLDIQVKLDKAGNVRLNLFSHSADEFTSFLDYSQRNGVGISYQNEYRTTGEFLKNLFTCRKKKQPAPRVEEEQVVVNIE